MLPPELQQLITNFSDHYESYKRPDYNETALRRDFLDKFIKILGWDVDNEANLHEAFREVIHEDRLKINEQSKAPDYCIQQGSAKVFYIEAKKPSVNLRDDPSPALQVRRYGWTAGMPVCLLSDFDEFAVYDTSVKPKNTDNAAVARIFYCNYKDLDVHNPKNTDKETNWEYLYKLFSKEAVWKGSLLKLKASNKKKGTQEVDEVFLQEIEVWREALAANITNRNAAIQERELNYVIQKTIDRIIFLRICEDRGIEEEGKLKAAAAGKGEPVGSVYKQLLKLFLDADDRYNSGLFHFHTEKATDDEPDTLSEKITIDDKVLKDIIKNLYYPDGPYEFAVLPADILGSIYERFLGKVIRLTPGHRAKVEDKPEVKKAGGVYYTPQYIVSYIVENTVGPQLATKTPASLKNFRIVDPACGSGSFLIVAYQYLLDWYLGQYTQKPDQYKKQLTKTGSGKTATDYKLTITERKRILTSHIYGVDIDTQAVEVARLSLLLKALEGLNSQEIQKELFNERVLPNLSGNVKCGNSLIGNDFYAQGVLGFTEEEQLKINAFDWEKEYPEVFKDGGFDVVVGNPPYVKEYTSRETFEDIKKSYLSKYYQGKMDLWYFFVCWGLDILKENGKLGFITPSNWTTNSGASILRHKIMTAAKITNYVDFGDFMVFKEASIQTCVFILNKQPAPANYPMSFNKVLSKNINITELISYLQNGQTTQDVSTTDVLINPESMKEGLITFVGNLNESILQNISSRANYIFNEKDIGAGIDIHQDFISKKHLEILKDATIQKGDGVFNISESERKNLNLNAIEKEIVKPFYTTNELGVYYGNPKNSLWVIYSDLYVRQNISKYPNIKKHLDKYKKIITSDFAPYGLHRARDQKFFEGEKLISLRKTPRPCFTYTDFPCYVSQTYYVLKPQGINIKYLLGILNSNLMYFWLYNRGKKQGEQLQVDKEPLLAIPVFIGTEAQQTKIIEYVDQMLELKKREQAETVPQTKTMIGRQIVALDTQIDKAVYELYGLTEEEIKVVEGEG
ncbi:adenine methyltransferase [Spirochaetia bacterium]|nr:adenine methyltransferase [Spirochaetia bacterium]